MKNPQTRHPTKGLSRNVVMIYTERRGYDTTVRIDRRVSKYVRYSVCLNFNYANKYPLTDDKF